MGLDFVLLARCTPFHIFHNPIIYAVSGCNCPCLSDHLIVAWVPCCGVIVHQEHDGPFHFCGYRFGGDSSSFELFWSYDYLLLIIIFSLVDSGRMGQHIRGNIVFTQDMLYFIVVFL